MRAMPCGETGSSWHSDQPDDGAGESRRAASNGRPRNSRTPFQIMPQAMKIMAAGMTGGSRNNWAGALHKAIEEAPIR